MHLTLWSEQMVPPAYLQRDVHLVKTKPHIEQDYSRQEERTGVRTKT